jgi:hypothetical protein
MTSCVKKCQELSQRSALLAQSGVFSLGYATPRRIANVLIPGAKKISHHCEKKFSNDFAGLRFWCEKFCAHASRVPKKKFNDFADLARGTNSDQKICEFGGFSATYQVPIAGHRRKT